MTRHISKRWLKAVVGLGVITFEAAATPAHVVMDFAARYFDK